MLPFRVISTVGSRSVQGEGAPGPHGTRTSLIQVSALLCRKERQQKNLSASSGAQHSGVSQALTFPITGTPAEATWYVQSTVTVLPAEHPSSCVGQEDRTQLLTSDGCCSRAPGEGGGFRSGAPLAPSWPERLCRKTGCLLGNQSTSTVEAISISL